MAKVKQISKPASKVNKPSRPKKQNKRFGFQSLQPGNRVKRDNSDLPSSFKLFGLSYNFLIKNWKIMGGITLVYAVLFFVFVRVGSSADLDEYKSLIDDYFGVNSSGVFRNITLAGVALASVSQGSDQAQTLIGLFLFIVTSLAFIWAIRHIFAQQTVKIKDAYYKGQEPLIPFLLMSILIAIHAIPFAIGGLIFSIVTSQNIAIGAIENIIFIFIWIIFALISGYFITNSTMALYAVTLPDMYPLQALRATKELVKHRRWFILRKILFLPIALFIIFGTIFLFLTSVAPSVVFIYLYLSVIVMLPFVHVYLYHLYRSLV